MDEVLWRGKFDLGRRQVRDLRSGEWRDATWLDHMEAVRLLALPEGNHPLVQRAYDRARRLLLYSWVERDFVEVAELEAIRSLEFYLGEKTRPTVVPDGRQWRPAPLGKLLNVAKKNQWLCDTEELRSARFAHLGGLDYLESIGPDWKGPKVFPHLLTWLTEYRNTLAHGSQLHGPWGGYAALRVVRELLCQASAKPVQ